MTMHRQRGAGDCLHQQHVGPCPCKQLAAIVLCLHASSYFRTTPHLRHMRAITGIDLIFVMHMRSFKVGQTYAQKFTSPDGTVTAQGIFVDSNPFITAYNSTSSGYHQQYYVSHVRGCRLFNMAQIVQHRLVDHKDVHSAAKTGAAKRESVHWTAVPHAAAQSEGCM